MNSDNSRKISSRLNFLGIYQIVGGAIGVLLIFWSLLKTEQTTGPIILVYLLIFLFFAFSIYCGIHCLRAKSQALRFSLINQILQVIGFAMFGFAFQYAAGAYMIVGLDLTESVNLTFGAGVSKFDFNLNIESQRLELNFNFIALALILFIERFKKLMRENEDEKQVSSIAAN